MPMSGHWPMPASDRLVSADAHRNSHFKRRRAYRTCLSNNLARCILNRWRAIVPFIKLNDFSVLQAL
jgi:hypothetical protein